MDLYHKAWNRQRTDMLSLTPEFGAAINRSACTSSLRHSMLDLLSKYSPSGSASPSAREIRGNGTPTIHCEHINTQNLTRMQLHGAESNGGYLHLIRKLIGFIIFKDIHHQNSDRIQAALSKYLLVVINTCDYMIYAFGLLSKCQIGV